jgi:hypothetical protein
MLEKSTAVDQVRDARRRQAILARIQGQEAVLRSHGTVVASWRSCGGQRLGPYYRLAYCEEGRRRSIYLGRSEELAAQVRALLAHFQAAEIQRRDWRRLRRTSKVALRQQRLAWAQKLAEYGFCVKGYEVRNWHAGQLGLISAAVRARSRRHRRAAVLKCPSET